MTNQIPLAAGALLGGWTPARSGPLHWLLAPLVNSTANFTVTGLDVDSALDAAGGALVLSKVSDPRRPVIVNTDQMNGSTCVRFSRTAGAGAGSSLVSAVGGIVGAVDHEIGMLAKWTDNLVDASGFDPFAQFGREGGSYTSDIGRSYTTGNVATLVSWAGGSGQGGPTGYIGNPDESDNLYHFTQKIYNAATQRLIILRDGRPIFNPDSTNGGYALSLATGVTAPALGVTYPDFGFARIVAGYPIPNTDLLTSLFYNKVVSYADRVRTYRWLASKYPARFAYSQVQLTAGDSRAWGYGVAKVDRYTSIVAAARSRLNGNSAVGSTTMATALVNSDVSLLCCADGTYTAGTRINVGSPTLLIVDAGINDIVAGRTAAQIFADELAIYAAARSAYPGIVCVSIVCLPDSGLTGPQEGVRGELNALRAGGTNTASYYVSAAGSTILVWNGTDYFDTVHLTEVGHAKLATAFLATVPA